MNLPNADNAVISPGKIRDYLLNTSHRRGATKARRLQSLGYGVDSWQRLEVDLREQHLPAPVESVQDTDYGTRYTIVAPLKGPSGVVAKFRSVWQIDTGTEHPRLLTMYPEK